MDFQEAIRTSLVEILMETMEIDGDVIYLEQRQEQVSGMAMLSERMLGESHAMTLMLNELDDLFNALIEERMNRQDSDERSRTMLADVLDILDPDWAFG